MTTFAMTCFCIHSCCLCIVRIICLNKMSTLDEEIGEVRVRMTTALVTIVFGTAATITLILRGEVTTGSVLTLTGNKPLLTGEISIGRYFSRRKQRE